MDEEDPVADAFTRRSSGIEDIQLFHTRLLPRLVRCLRAQLSEGASSISRCSFIFNRVGVVFDVRITPNSASIGSRSILLGPISTLALTIHPIFAGNNDSPKSSAAEMRRGLRRLSELWFKQDAAQGIPKFENLLAQTELVFGKDSPAVGLVLSRIGFLYSKRGDFERAVPYLERSLKLVSPLPDNAENLQRRQISIGDWA